MSAYVKIEQQAEETSSPKKQQSKKRGAACMRERSAPNVETRAMAALRRSNAIRGGACKPTPDDKRQRALPHQLAARQPAAPAPGEEELAPACCLREAQPPGDDAAAQLPSPNGAAAPNDGKTRLPVCRSLLFAGGSATELKPNVHVFPDLACEAHCMMQYIARSMEGEEYEVLLVLQRSGRLMCFKRRWHGESPQGCSPVELAEEATLVGPQSGVLADVGTAESSTPAALVRLGNLDKIVVCVDECVCMYEAHLERLASGLKVETKLERAFKARLPPSLQSTNVRSLAFHPVDKNLYAIGTGDAKIVVQSFQLHEHFQTIPAGASPPLVAFSASGRAFICVTAGGGGVRLQTRVVGEDVLAPFSGAVVTRDQCVDLEDFRKRKAEEKAKNKAALETWAQEQAGRTTLLTPECLESNELPQGMPLRIVPASKQGDQRNEDFVLLSWPTELEVWQVRPLRRVGWKKMADCACTAVFAFFSRSGRQRWLLGTSLGQVHVLSAWATSGEQELCEVKVVDVLPEDSAPKAITSISTLNNVSDAQIPQALLYVGFRDGSVSAQHSLADLLAR